MLRGRRRSNLLEQKKSPAEASDYEIEDFETLKL